MVMMDVEKAFDSMDHGFLLKVLDFWLWRKFYQMDKYNIDKPRKLCNKWGKFYWLS